jgi:hypothetical protein
MSFSFPQKPVLALELTALCVCVCVCVWGGGGFESMSVCRFITSERRPWFGPILIFIITTALLLDRPFDGFQHSRQLDVYD